MGRDDISLGVSGVRWPLESYTLRAPYNCVRTLKFVMCAMVSILFLLVGHLKVSDWTSTFASEEWKCVHKIFKMIKMIFKRFVVYLSPNNN